MRWSGALRGRLDLVGQRQVEQSARDQGVDLDTPGGLAQVAASDDISLFIRGTVRPRGNRAQVSIEFLGPNGRELAEEGGTITANGGGMRQLARAMGRGLRRAVQNLDEDDGDQGWNQDPPTRIASRAPEPDDEDESLSFLEDDNEEPPDVDYGDDDYRDDEDEDEEDEEDEDEGDDDDEDIEGALPMLEVFAGFGGRIRDADIKLETAGPSPVSRVYSATFGEIYGRVAFRPFGPDGGMLAGLTASAEFAYAVGLSSVNQETQEDISTSAFRAEGGLGWLLGPFGPVRIGPEVDFGYDSFSLDPNPILPTANYIYVRPGAALLLDIVSPYLQVKVDAGLRLVLGTGDLAPFFGESASAVGLDTGIELVGNLDMGLAYGGRFAFQSFGLAFDGVGTPPNNTAIDGTDQRLVFTLFVGYRLW